MRAPEDLNADYAEMSGTSRQVLETATTLENLPHALREIHDTLMAGVGELADAVRPGATTFMLSWATALQTMSEGGAVVGNNINRSVIDLTAVDTGTYLPRL
jgi:hypothetical protein